ncbi:Titin [Mizuhopecten yessoensis]|uniref:Titin n=1 Tax=Mizuhopecten yessoensis TaxID=6573 RepID=A0A210Q5Z9_MIZYE|nr:Titin [Mizuhopecten yessoensis]
MQNNFDVSLICILGKPRPYLVPDDHHTVDIPLSKTLTIPAVFISNPEPLFTWTFQLNQLTAAKELVNGTDNFAIQNNFEKANVSALSVGIRTNIQEEWFGLYHVTATNSQGSAIVSFTVRAQRNPSPTKMLSVDCGKQISAKVSWKDGGNSQFYRVLFSMDAFEHSEEVYPLTIAFEEGRNIYNLNVDNLVGGRLYTFKIAAYNTYGNTTSLDTVGCTVQEGNGRLPFIKGQHLKQSEFQNVQLSERAVTPNEEEDERSPYEQLDTNEIAKASVYSEIESHLPGRRRDPVNDKEYESLEGRSNPNVYEDLHGTTSGEKEIYINTAIADGGSGSGN